MPPFEAGRVELFAEARRRITGTSRIREIGAGERPKPPGPLPDLIKPDPAARRLAVLAEVLETPLPLLESFLDFLAEEEMTDRRIADAQHVMGLCTPICSHLRFPKMDPPAVGRELLAEWQRRHQV